MNDTQATTGKYPYDYWSRVFARIFHKAIKSEELHAAYPSIQLRLERYCTDGGKKWLERALNSEDAAYNFFAEMFTRLTPSEQKIVTGKTYYEWCDAERAYRQNAGVLC